MVFMLTSGTHEMNEKKSCRKCLCCPSTIMVYVCVRWEGQNKRKKLWMRHREGERKRVWETDGKGGGGKQRIHLTQRLMDIYQTRQRMLVNTYVFEKSACHHIRNVSYLPWLMDVLTHWRMWQHLWAHLQRFHSFTQDPNHNHGGSLSTPPGGRLWQHRLHC
jgi:hypothetical protein